MSKIRNAFVVLTALLTGAAVGVTTPAEAAPAAPAATSVHGVDVSGNNNTSSAQINWSTVAANENFAFIKATEGGTYTSPYLATGWSQMTAVNIPRAPFHFLLPTTDGSVAAQANHFVSAIRSAGYTGAGPGELPPVLDLEWDYRDGKCPSGITAAGVKSFLDTLRSAFHRDPIVYTNKNFLSECGLNAGQFAASTLLWIADYTASSAPVPSGWGTWTFWQYTSSAVVPGIPTKADRSWFNGSLSDLRRLAGLSGAARDVTGNGWDDVVARNGSNENLYVYDGIGSGKLAAPKQLGTGWGAMTAVLTGEFSGDGKPDLIGIQNSGDMYLYPGTGNGTFGAGKKLGSGWGSMKFVVTADFTGDGHNDLAGIQNGSGDLYLYAGGGNGTFAAPRKLASGWGGQTALVAGDFNHDGHGDLVGRTADGTLNVYTGHGDAQFNAPAPIGHGWADMTALIPGDFTGDGYTDLLGRTADGAIQLYPMGSDGSLGAEIQLGTGWNGLDLFQS